MGDDKRRTARLVQVAADLSVHTGSSLAVSCEDTLTSVEGAYRLMENQHVEPPQRPGGRLQPVTVNILSAQEVNEEWKVLWVTQENKPLPKKVPTLTWLFHAIAKLGGWCDSKRTGIPGWQVVWEGWAKLQDCVLTYRLTRAIQT